MTRPTIEQLNAKANRALQRACCALKAVQDAAPAALFVDDTVFNGDGTELSPLTLDTATVPLLASNNIFTGTTNTFGQNIIASGTSPSINAVSTDPSQVAYSVAISGAQNIGINAFGTAGGAWASRSVLYMVSDSGNLILGARGGAGDLLNLGGNTTTFALSVKSDNTLQFNQYTTGVLQTDSAGIVTSGAVAQASVTGLTSALASKSNLAGGNTFTGNQTLTGHLLFSADNTYDIGASGATRPRTIYAAGNIVSGATTTQSLIGQASGFPGVWFGSNATTPSTTNYGFLYDSVNGTILNTPSGKSFYFRVNNANKMVMDSTGLITVVGDAIANTPTDKLTLSNTTAAATGTANQQFSPALHFSGQGWKTTATAASQSVDFREYVVPIESTTNPSANLVWDFSVNGGAYANKMTLSSAAALSGLGSLTSSTISTLGVNTTGAGNTVGFGTAGTYNSSSTQQVQFSFHPVITQTGTAGFTALKITPFLSSVGSGVNLLFDVGTNTAQAGGGTHTSKFNIDNNGLTTISGNAIANTPTDRLVLSNTTSAATGAANQQYSPALTFSGQGWKSNATAASQAINFRQYVIPVEGTTAASGQLNWDISLAGGAYANIMKLTTGGAFTINTGSGTNTITLLDATISKTAGTGFKFNSNVVAAIHEGDTAAAQNINVRSTANASRGTINFDTFWQIPNTGHLFAQTDNTYDIGAGGATRPRNVYVGTSIGVGTAGTPGFDIDINKSAGGAGVWNRTKNSATSGYSALSLGTAALENKLNIYSFGSTYSSSGQYQANQNLFEANGSLYLTATDFRFHTGSIIVGGATTAPTAKVDIFATSEQLRIGYDASNYFKTTVGSAGSTTFDLAGTAPTFTFSKAVTVTPLASTNSNGRQVIADAAGAMTAPLVFVPWTGMYGQVGQTFPVGTGATVNGQNNVTGIKIAEEITTGTTTTGGAVVILSSSTVTTNTARGHMLASDFNTFEMEQKIRIPTLSDGTETFQVNIGFMNASSAGNTIGTDGVFAQITTATMSLIGRAASVDTAGASTFTVVVNTTYTLKVIWNPLLATAQMYVDGTLITTITTTGLPATSAIIAPKIQVIKSAGTTSRTLYWGMGYFKAN